MLSRALKVVSRRAAAAGLEHTSRGLGMCFRLLLLIRTSPADRGSGRVGDEEGASPRALLRRGAAVKLREILRELVVVPVGNYIGCAGHRDLAHGSRWRT